MPPRPAEVAHLAPLWLGVGVTSLVALVAFGVVAGRALVGGGLLALLGALAFEECEVFRLAPLDTAIIALLLMPWLELAACALALVVLGVALRRIAAAPKADSGLATAEGAVA